MSRVRMTASIALALCSLALLACGAATGPGGEGDGSVVDGADGSRSTDGPDDNHICAPGTCMLYEGGQCEVPTGDRGNACCKCTGDICTFFCTCTASDTPIATPEGYRPIASLVVGDLVYGENRGALQAVPILKTSHVRVEGHTMVRATLSNGTVLRISPHHPTADGRFFADLAKGDALDQLTVMDIAVVPYDEPFTYDILPDSDTGTYIAGGALVGSTLWTRVPQGP